MNPLHVMGLCEVREHSVPRTRRGTIRFNRVLRDDRVGDRTVVTDKLMFASAEVKLGAGTEASWELEGELQYDERGGQWFGIEPSFSSTSVFYIAAEAAYGDVLRVQGFAPSPVLCRKTLVNLGPASVVVSGREDNHEGVLHTAVDIVLLPNDACRLFWDAVDKCYRLISRCEWRVTDMPAYQLVLKGHPIRINGRPLVNSPPALSRRVPARPKKPEPAPPVVELASPFVVEASVEASPTVAVHRFPQRATSVIEDMFVELGVLRYDNLYVGVTFAAELAGQGAELQLWNLTEGYEVATLRGSSGGYERYTTPVELPNADALYSVRLRRAGSSRRVFCSKAAFEVTL